MISVLISCCILNLIHDVLITFMLYISTATHRESWDALNETLQGVPKDAPLMTYCTGSRLSTDLLIDVLIYLLTYRIID